jgi:hypothetical protein
MFCSGIFDKSKTSFVKLHAEHRQRTLKSAENLKLSGGKIEGIRTKYLSGKWEAVAIGFPEKATKSATYY